MAADDPDLDELTERISRCLAGIDEHVEAMREHGEHVGFDVGDELELSTSELHELIDSVVLVDMGAERCDVNAIVAGAARACVGELTIPIVLRQQLCDAPAEVAVPAPLVAATCKRTLALVLDCLTSGSELTLTTGIDADAVRFVVGCTGGDAARIALVTQLAETVRDFTADLGGRFAVRAHGRDVAATVELPRVVESERIDSE